MPLEEPFEVKVAKSENHQSNDDDDDVDDDDDDDDDGDEESDDENNDVCSSVPLTIANISLYYARFLCSQ